MIITGGGTAGHVTPLLAVVDELNKQNSQIDIRYIGQFGDPMRAMFSEAKITNQYSILAGKWRRYHGLSFIGHISDLKTLFKNIRDLFYFTIGLIQSTLIMIFWRPNVVFVKGGFVGLPVGLAAAFLKIPIVTHDSDTLPGLTNRILSRYSKLSAVAMPKEYYLDYYNESKMRYTGVPLRQEYYNISAKHTAGYLQEFSIFVRNKIVTVIGGSLGAVRLNNAVLKNVDKLLSDKDVVLIWVTGKRQYQQILSSISANKNRNRIKIYAFCDELYKILAISDVVVSRAGATSIAELAELSKPTILVPNPYLVGGHQTKNACALSSAKAVDVIFEDQLCNDSDILSTQVFKILTDNDMQKRLSNNIHKLAISDSSKRIVDAIFEVCK